MIRGLYKSASGMVPQAKKQEITANNIANANTAGYKKDQVFLNELDRATGKMVPKKSVWQTPMLDQVYTDYTQGEFDRTGNSFDLAIGGRGFFVVESPDGAQQLYTRNGSFTIDTEGYLATLDGLRVMGDGGPIAIGEAETVDISEAGQIYINEEQVGQVQVVDFPDYDALVKVGGSGFELEDEAEPTPSEDFTIHQGYVEKANINVIKEMVGMILTLRSYEAGAKAIQSQDESLEALFRHVAQTNM